MLLMACIAGNEITDARLELAKALVLVFHRMLFKKDLSNNSMMIASIHLDIHVHAGFDDIDPFSKSQEIYR